VPEDLPPPATQQDLSVVEQRVERLDATVRALDARTQQLELLPDQVARIQQALPTLKIMAKKPPPRRQPRLSTPLDVVQQAQAAARVEPTEIGYWGSSGEHAFTWRPGAIYTVYLTPKHPTLIALEPGEREATGLVLDPKEYTVESKLIGTDILAYSAISITPLIDKGSVDGYVISDTGRRYLLHFVVGSQGMLAVTFQTPSLTRVEEPKRPLPRPSQSTTPP
jgi:hypothetical protein